MPGQTAPRPSLQQYWQNALEPLVQSVLFGWRQRWLPTPLMLVLIAPLVFAFHLRLGQTLLATALIAAVAHMPYPSVVAVFFGAFYGAAVAVVPLRQTARNLQFILRQGPV